MKSLLYTQAFALLLHLVSSNLAAISQLPTALQQNQQEASNQLTELNGLLKAALPIDTLLIVYQVPTTISVPGTYTVIQDLTFNGAGAAITVTSDNVTINFLNHSLLLSNPNSTGISAENINEFTIENAIIQGRSAAAIQLENVSNAALNNVYTQNSNTALDIANSQEIQVYASQFSNSGPVHIDGSSHVTIDSCTFNGIPSAKGLFVEGSSGDITITNSNFSNALSAIYVAKVDGMLIDHCQASASAQAINLVQLGSLDAGNLANTVIIRNSIFTQHTPVAGFDGILILAGSGYFFENLIVDTASEDPVTGNVSAALHIGYAANDPCLNLLASNCLFTGTNPRSVFIENGNKIVFDECQISGATKYNLQMLNATSCTVKNCMVFNGDSGIYIDNTTGGGTNSVKDCYVYDNTTTGIVVNDMKKNNLLGNHVWGSQVGIQIAFSAFTEAFFNTSCNNSEQNCSNVYPNQLPGGTPPGTADIAGANLCCDP